MADKVTAVEKDLSEMADGKGEMLQSNLPPDHAQVPVVLNLPERLCRISPGAYSMGDITILHALNPSPVPNARTVDLLGGKQLELLLNVLVIEGGHHQTLRALIDTGAKVPLIINFGFLTTPVSAASTLNLVTANGSPMRGWGFHGSKDYF